MFSRLSVFFSCNLHCRFLFFSLIGPLPIWWPTVSTTTKKPYSQKGHFQCKNWTQWTFSQALEWAGLFHRWKEMARRKRCTIHFIAHPSWSQNRFASQTSQNDPLLIWCHATWGFLYMFAEHSAAGYPWASKPSNDNSNSLAGGLGRDGGVGMGVMNR